MEICKGCKEYKAYCECEDNMETCGVCDDFLAFCECEKEYDNTEQLDIEADTKRLLNTIKHY